VKPTLYLVTIEVSPGSEAEWNTWHEQVHIPEVLRQPGFLSCRKWRDTATAEDGWVRYVCHYELAGTEAVERYAASEAAKHLRTESDLRFGYVTRVRRQVYTEVARFEVDEESS
jgi:antibiotic biosynthesis monooxygenase (ABM) superfamily enzyme